MRDSGGGGGNGGSDWSAANVRHLWELVKEQETEAHWKLVTGWRRSAELTAAHLARVQNYRNNLATAWPPEKSPAAAAYLARLDEMITNLRETNEAAVANYTAFATTTGALSTSRSELKKLYDEYVANEDKIQQYEKAKAAALASPSPSPTPTPSPSPGPSALPSRPPVTSEQQEQLNWKARSVMYELSGTLVEARAQIKLPTPYKPPAYNGAHPPEGADVGGGGAPPPIPPIVVTPNNSRSAESPSRRPASRTGGLPGSQTLDPALRVPGSNGPTLVGTAPVITPPSLSMPPVLPMPGPGTPVNTSIIGGPPPLLAPSILPPGTESRLTNPSTGALPPTRIGTDGASGGVAKPGTGGGGGGAVRPMPPGGVIGQPPAMGLGQPAAGRPPAQRVNPVGGVIGAQPQAAGWGPAGGRGQQSGPAGSSQGRGRSARYSQSDDPWRTDEGVPPVVSPPREPGRVDPGPAIGLDR